MQKTLADVAKAFVDSGHGQEDLFTYLNMKEHPGWKVHREFLIVMGSILANRVLERKFQELDGDEKLIELAAYSKVNEVIKFLLDPVPGIQRLAKIRKHNKQQLEATKNRGATKRRE